MRPYLLGPDSAAPDLERDGGGKAAHLAQLHALGVCVPPWVCIPAVAFDEHLLRSGVAARPMPEPDPVAEAAFAAQVETMFAAVPIAPEWSDVVRAALTQPALADSFLAVRSSGIGEDSADPP